MLRREKNCCVICVMDIILKQSNSRILNVNLNLFLQQAVFIRCSGACMLQTDLTVAVVSNSAVNQTIKCLSEVFDESRLVHFNYLVTIAFGIIEFEFLVSCLLVAHRRHSLLQIAIAFIQIDFGVHQFKNLVPVSLI